MSISLTKTAILATSLTLGVIFLSSAQAAPTKPAARRPAQTQGRPNSSGNTITAAPANSALNAAYNNYLDGLRQKIDNKWYLADGNNHVTLSMTVATDGSVTEMEINSSPKNTQAEQAASDAFNGVQPLPALPSGSNNIKMTLSFDSKASQHDNERHLSGRIDVSSKSSDGSTTTQSSSSSSTDSSSSSSESSSSASSADSSSSSNSSSSTQTDTK